MLPELNFLPTNWVDGMKINEDHLNHLELSTIDHIRDAIGIHLNSLNFGLVSAHNEREPSLSLKIRTDQTRNISANLIRCRAVTKSGARIEIVENLAKKFNFNLDALSTDFDPSGSKSKEFYVVISVHPEKRVPAGQPIQQETPVRSPYTAPTYSLKVVAADNDLLENIPANSIPIGKVIAKGNSLQVDDQYIPPCMVVRNHPVLYDLYFDMGNKLGEISGFLLSIIHKIKSKSQNTTLTQNLNFLAEKVLFFTANELGRYRWILAEQPPVFMCEYFIRLAYVMKTSIDCTVDRDKEELVNYLSEWSELSPGQFEGMLSEVIRTEYNHLDLRICLQPAENMLNSLHALFGKLSQLEFIGKRKGEGSFVRERIIDAEEPKKDNDKPKQKGWSFLAD